jgi:anti-sigma regulatory factor (Ser/Thr protein kinase)
MTPSPPLEAVGSWPATAVSVRAARRFATATLEQWCVEDLTDTIALVVSELSSNAVVHAGSRFTVTLSRLPDGVLVRVNDTSVVRPALTGPAPASATRGRGLLLVEAVTAAWGATSDDAGGKAVWALVADGADCA